MNADLSQRLPIDPDTGSPLPPRAHPGYYPGFDTLSQQAFWDQATRDLILARVSEIPPIRFFTDRLPLAQAVFDRILPQDDRDAEHRIPIVNFVDERLWSGRTDGYRYDQMPPDDEAYTLGLEGIDRAAEHDHGHPFVDLDPHHQEAVLLTVKGGNPAGGDEIWRRVLPNRFWHMLVSDAINVYYAHPYAWDEIGFGGPSYPRGYMRLRDGLPEPWEKPEERYAWAPPPDSLSGEFGPPAGLYPEQATPSQEGTH